MNWKYAGGRLLKAGAQYLAHKYANRGKLPGRHNYRTNVRLKPRYRGQGGNSKTILKRKKKKIASYGNKDDTCSYTVIGHKRRIQLPGISRMLHHTLNGGNHISTATGGVQVMFETGQMFNDTDLTSIVAVALRESTTAGGALQTYNSSSKIYLQGCVAVNRIVNTANVGVTLFLFDWVAKHDLAVTVDSIATVQAGLVVEDAAAGANDQTIIGIRPTDSFEFLHNFLVKKITRVCLAPGEMHTHVYKNLAHKVTDSYMRNAFKQFKGLYSGTLMVAYGDNVHTAAAAAVTTGTVGLDITQSREYTFAAASGGGAARTISNNLASTATANQLVTLPESDVPATPVVPF